MSWNYQAISAWVSLTCSSSLNLDLLWLINWNKCLDDMKPSMTYFKNSFIINNKISSSSKRVCHQSNITLITSLFDSHISIAGWMGLIQECSFRLKVNIKRGVKKVLKFTGIFEKYKNWSSCSIYLLYFFNNLFPMFLRLYNFWLINESPSRITINWWNNIRCFNIISHFHIILLGLWHIFIGSSNSNYRSKVFWQ